MDGHERQRCRTLRHICTTLVSSPLTDLIPLHEKKKDRHSFSLTFHTHSHMCTHTHRALVHKKPLLCINTHYLIHKQHQSCLVILTEPCNIKLHNERPSSIADYSLLTPVYGFHCQIKSSWEPINRSISMRSSTLIACNAHVTQLCVA